jgi:tetratricopeptide (TPR) repeat protein
MDTPLAVIVPAPSEAPAPTDAERRELDVLARGDTAFDAGDLALARRHYEQARSLAPDSPHAPVRLVRVRCAELGLEMAYAEAPQHAELEQMVSQLEALTSRHPDAASAWLERGRLLLVLGDAERAQESSRRAVALDDRNAEAHSALGVAYLASGQVQAALEQLEAAARLAPEQPERLTNLGTVYMLRGRVTEAIATYERALTLAPDDARTHGDLGAAHLANNRPDLALPHLSRATALAPDRATFLTNLGYAYQKQGLLDKAVESQRRAIALDPKLGSAWINLGNALAELGQYEAAREALRRAESLDPSDPRPKASLRDLAELESRQPARR